MIGRRRFSRDRHGYFRTGLDRAERDLLKTLPSQAQLLLEARDESTRRVFPVAYPHDAKADGEYREMMGDHLHDRHRRALEVLATTADSPNLDDEEIHQWLDALEILRLVLGTQLDISEDGTVADQSDERGPELALYQYLSVLQGEIIDALAETLPQGDARGDPEDP